MFAVWNDHVGNGISTKDIHDRLLPLRYRPLAVKMWTGATVATPYDESLMPGATPRAKPPRRQPGRAHRRQRTGV